ncbi:ATP-binding protein [Nonomuraea sp. 3N208]|uniref:ATP-binding protein n=1 Tax=Nonomuraea sp. 3N208 TaxID=3457421 RepID=UPI003FCF3404
MATPTGWRREGNLPAELTSFIGRTRLLANLKRYLGESRLVTVTGIGGVGKSRTVLRLAHQVRAQYPDGVWFADLARLQDTGMVKHTIASALRIADQSTRAESETLSEWVGERDMLLIIDTCDRVVQGAAELVQELLEAAPNLKVLATSRQSLNLPYEHVLPVPPLQIPGEDPAETYFVNESVQLFAARAGASVPDFHLDEDNINAVAELCRRLDGIPLAIELAAVRLRALSVEQILGLLADRFSLLAGASRTALPRHQTLRAAIGWSHELCEPAERLLWARLSVFANDFELDAARFVCSDARLPSGRITDLVTGLVEKSILLIRSNHAGVRYKLIDTLADYGDEWLDKLGEKDRMRQRHLEYYLSLAQRSEDAWSGPRQIYWFVRMRQEHDNVRVALEHALKTPGKEVLALTLLSSLWFMWVCCGFAREGRLYLERALEANPDLSRERCKALWVLSYVRSAQGDSVGAREAAETCSTEAVRVGDSRAVILASKMQGTAAMLQGDLQKASALLGVAIEFNPDNKELNPGLLPAIVELSIVLTTQGELNEAESLLQDCLQVCRERGELWLSSYAHWALSLPMLAMGRADEALRTALEGLRIKRHFHDTVGTLMVLETVAKIYSTQGQIERASRLLGALHQNWRSSGLPMLGAPFLTAEHEKCVQECKRTLGEDGYKLEFEAGTKLDLDEAVTLAQEEFDDLQGPDRNTFGP